MTLEDAIRLRPHHIERLFLDWPMAGDEQVRKALEGQKHKYDEKAIEYYFDLYNRIRNNEPLILIPSFDSICSRCHYAGKNEECAVEYPNHNAFVREEFGMGLWLWRPYTAKQLLETGTRTLKAKNAADEFGEDWWTGIPREERLKAYEALYKEIRNDA